MPLYQLRQYFFKTAEAAQSYIAIWPHHVESLKVFDITTHGFFSADADPLQVIALVSYPDGADPEQVTRGYMQSAGFAKDMAGFDVSTIDHVEERMLTLGVGSPQP